MNCIITSVIYFGFNAKTSLSKCWYLNSISRKWFEIDKSGCSIWRVNISWHHNIEIYRIIVHFIKPIRYSIPKNFTLWACFVDFSPLQWDLIQVVFIYYCQYRSSNRTCEENMGLICCEEDVFAIQSTFYKCNFLKSRQLFKTDTYCKSLPNHIRNYVCS